MISVTDNLFDSDLNFSEKALQIFNYQKAYNPIYKTFCNALGVNEVKSVQEIPLLPIEAFKEVDIITAGNNSTFSIQHLTLFKSSGTSGMKRSRHYLLNPEIYRQSVLHGMRQFYHLDE